MSPSRGGGGDEEALAVGDGGGGSQPLGPPAAAATATEEGEEEAGLGPDMPGPEGRHHRRRWWMRTGGGVFVLAVVVAAAVVVGVLLRGGGEAGSSATTTTGPRPGQSTVLPETSIAASKGIDQQQPLPSSPPLQQQQQQQQPSSAVDGGSGVDGTTAVSSPLETAGNAGRHQPGQQQQAAATAANLNDLATQLLGNGGWRGGAGDGPLDGQGQEEEEAEEDSFIAVEGCTPNNYQELHFLVERSSCPVITLVPGARYNFSDFIVVRRPVLVVGRPLDPPTLDAHLAYRAFLVEAGGVLDLRHVVIYRGRPIEVIEPELFSEVRGGAAYIRNGGTGLFTDCVMTTYEDSIGEVLITTQPQTTVRLTGAFLLLEAGTLHIIGCHIAVQRAGVLFREVYTVGGFILVVQGTLLLTGSTLTASFLFITVLGAGNFLTVLGGNAVVTGTVFTLNGGFVASQGVGLLQFVGVGTSTFTGCVSQGNLGFFSFFGAGLGLFTGGGVSILTGVAISSVSVMNFGAGIGFNNGLGGGVMVKTGVVQSGSHSQSALAVLGVATYVGAGTVVYAETAWNRNTALTAFYGGGGSLYLGGGVATIVNSASFGATATVFAASAGGDHLVLGGWLTMVNSWFFKWVSVAVYYGQGVDTAVIAGGALIANSGYTGAPPIVHTSRNLYSIYVSGQQVELEDARDVILVTHKQYWVKNNGTKGKGRRRLQEQLLPDTSLRSLNLTGGVRVVDGAGAGAARLVMQGVEWRDASPGLFRRAFEESAAEGVPAQWPWRLQGLMAAEEEEEERVGRRRQQGQEEEAAADVSPVAAAPPGPEPEQQEEEEQGAEGDTPLVPLYPGSPVLVPRAAPRPIEGPGAVSRVYLASPLARCRACGVRASAGADADASGVRSTAAAFAGAGAEGCDFAEACEAVGEAAEGEGDDGDIMWMVPPGSGHMPNTSLAVLDLVVASSTSSSSSSSDPIAPQAVLRAVNRTIAGLGLGSRYHLRVLPDSVPLPYDPQAEGGRMRRILQEQQAPDAAAAAEPPSSGPCSLRLPFRAYLVSDRPQVTGSIAKALRQPAATDTMTAALQEESEEACSLRVTRAVQTVIPGLNASALLLPPLSSSSGQRHQGPMAPVATGAGIVRLLAAAGKARPAHRMLFEDGVEDKEGRALAAGGARELHPTAALLLHPQQAEAEEEGEEAAAANEAAAHSSRATEVHPEETYALALARFPQGRRLRVRLVPEGGKQSALLGVVPSAPRGEGRRQVWAWTVDGGLAPGRYFLEVASDARDAFAYSQAFEVVAFS